MARAAAAVAAAARLFDSRAALWLTPDATRVFLARFVGCVLVALRPFGPAVADPATFTVLAVAAGVTGVLFSLAGWAATSAKDIAWVVLPETKAGPFTVAAGAAGRAAVLGDEVVVPCCCLASFHSLVLSTSLALFLPAVRLRRLPERVRSAVVATAVCGLTLILQQNSTLTSPRLLNVSSVAQTPFSTHSSKRVRRRDGVGPAAGGVQLLLGRGGGGPVRCCWARV